MSQSFRLAPILRIALCALALFAATLAVRPVQAGEAVAPLSAAETQAVETIIERYLLENPELMVRVFQNLEARQQAQREARTRDMLASSRDELVDDGRSLVLGNPDGDVTVVEFFDYRCGYCKQAHPTVKALIESDPNVRVVLKEFPILGPNSVIATQAAIASREQGLYAEFHDALLEHEGDLTEDAVYEIARGLGMDMSKLREDMGAPVVRETIAANMALAQRLAIDGTPTFIIGDALMPGALGLDTLRKAVETARTGCTTC
ncbi:DsbA family protein [Futiania mangrovi]|uniref:DsbA family protein n=1 Tax=Futiania mangrovi TaxID=2959716 RepID=A0A9J6PCZ6_9PROT|nr:DsbA family protein [Futiania mangrovii]MCP1335680.1 DsbA family protein [Futiania mangrovii]